MPPVRAELAPHPLALTAHQPTCGCARQSGSAPKFAAPVEQFFQRIKRFRRIAMELARNFLAFIISPPPWYGSASATRRCRTKRENALIPQKRARAHNRTRTFGAGCPFRCFLL